MRLQLSVILPVIAFIGTVAAAQNCVPYWTGNGAPIRTLSQMRGLVVFDDGGGPMLYATGELQGGGYRVARWDGSQWEILNQGLPNLGQTGSLLLLDEGAGPRLHVEKHTGSGGGIWTLKRWENGRWEDATPGLRDPLQGFFPTLTLNTSAGPVIYGVQLSGTSGNRFVRWDGQMWHTAGQPNSGWINRWIVFDDGSGPAVHVAGTFTSMNGYAASGIAKLKHDQFGPMGNVWEPLGLGVTWGYSVRDMTVHDDGTGPALYVTEVATAGGVPMNRIARWDGQNWSDVGGGILPVGIVAVHVLGSFDDGRGPALFAGGYMSMAGGNVPVRRIARYDGVQWDDVGGGLRGFFINSMAVYDDGRGPSLFVGGDISGAGGGALGSLYGIAQWVGCPNCYANCTNRQTEPRLTVDDFTCFIDKFAYGDPYVDCNQDGVRDIDDFHCFIARFVEGCP